MRYLILGAAGQVGQEFAKFLPPTELTTLAHDQVDVTNPESVRCALRENPSDVVVNLAAFHNVNACEEQPQTAFAVNALGALHVTRAAVEAGRKTVFFSSDYVFGADRSRRTAYTESDSPAPVNVYGASKVAGEQLIRQAKPEHLIVRTSSLFGVATSRKGWTFPELMLKKARAGEALRVVRDQYMAPTYTRDLVHTTLALLERGATGTVHLANGGSCSWYEFAVATLELADVSHPVEAVSSSAFPSPAQRPAFSQLTSARLAEFGIEPMPPWREALRAYLAEKGELAAPRSITA